MMERGGGFYVALWWSVVFAEWGPQERVKCR